MQQIKFMPKKESERLIKRYSNYLSNCEYDTIKSDFFTFLNVNYPYLTVRQAYLLWNNIYETYLESIILKKGVIL